MISWQWQWKLYGIVRTSLVYNSCLNRTKKRQITSQLNQPNQKKDERSRVPGEMGGGGTHLIALYKELH